MNDMEAVRKRVLAARGEVPLDTLIANTRLVNVYTGEVYPADIGISGGFVVFAGPGRWPGPAPLQRISADGKFAVPGLIDCHVHIESSMMSPAGFAAAVLVRGTTTVVTDPHEIGNVFGIAGVRYMLDATEKLPLRVFVQVPSCVPAVPSLETAGAQFGAAEVTEMLGWDRVIGLAEVMDYVGVVQQSARMRTILEAAARKHAIISGHCPGVSGQDLAAYMVAGPTSDHESGAADELLEKLRLGMVVEGRVSSFSESMSLLGPLVKKWGAAPTNLVFCTDDIWPDDLFRYGHMDRVVREAIDNGFPPVEAIRAATLHGALRYGLTELGAVAPGKRADLLLASDLESLQVEEVWVDGQRVARHGELTVELSKVPSEIETSNSVVVRPPLSAKDLQLAARPGHARERLRVVVLEPSGLRGLAEVELPVVDGMVDLSSQSDLCWLAVVERHGRNGNRSLSLVRGLELREGAVASTVAHDSHNLVLAGRSVDDMLLAAQHLARIGGGVCCVRAGQVLASLPLPIAGLMSPLPAEEMVAKLDSLRAALATLGLHPVRGLAGVFGLALPVIPHFGVTDLGTVDVDKQIVLPVWADEG